MVKGAAGPSVKKIVEVDPKKVQKKPEAAPAKPKAAAAPTKKAHQEKPQVKAKEAIQATEKSKPKAAAPVKQEAKATTKPATVKPTSNQIVKQATMKKGSTTNPIKVHSNNAQRRNTVQSKMEVKQFGLRNGQSGGVSDKMGKSSQG